MKALETIGFKKALAFVFWEIYRRLLHCWVILPPIRVGLLRLFGAKIGKDSVIMDINLLNLHHWGLGRLSVGRKCFIGDLTTLDVRGKLDLGDFVTLSSGVKIITHITVGYPDHPLIKLYPTREAGVKIENGVYIGTGAIILPGVIIGRESVVAAGAVVTRSVPAQTLVAGVPARQIKKLVRPKKQD